LNALDREILRLAVPAFGALVAEPLYILADTAVVGHLGTAPLGALAVSSTVLLTGYSLFIFLAYGTTGTIARLIGAGDEREAVRQSVQSMWLAAVIAATLMVAGWFTAPGLVRAFGAEGAVRAGALLYLRVSLAGVPALLLTLAGTGYLRGRQDTRTPLVVAIAANVVNLGLELVLIPGLGYGLGASALATVLAQTGAGVVYVQAVVRGARALDVSLRPDAHSMRALAVVARDLLVRTAALRAALALTTAVATRIGTADLAAHQVAFQVWNFLALALDALAIAAQAMVGRFLGAGDGGQARRASRRMIELGVGAGVAFGVLVLATEPVLPAVFTDDGEVRRLTGFLLWWVAAMQPVNAIAFVLDGVLIGAGDVRFLAWAMVGDAAVFALAAGLVLGMGLGIGWLWAALGVFMAARAMTLYARFARPNWIVLGHPGDQGGA